MNTDIWVKVLKRVLPPLVGVTVEILTFVILGNVFPAPEAAVKAIEAAGEAIQ